MQQDGVRRQNLLKPALEKLYTLVVQFRKPPLSVELPFFQGPASSGNPSKLSKPWRADSG